MATPDLTAFRAMRAPICSMAAMATILYGGTEADTLYGEAGNDVLSGGTGNDLLYGGANDDVLSGDANSDLLWWRWRWQRHDVGRNRG